MAEALVNLLMMVLDPLINAKLLDASALKIDATKDAFLLNIANQFWDTLVIFSIGLTIIYFLIEMNKKLALEGRDMNMKSFFAPFLKFLIAIAVLSQGTAIVSALLGISNAFIDNAVALKPSAEGVEGIKEALQIGLEKQCSQAGFIICLILFLPALVLWIVSLVLTLVYLFKALMYKIEFFFRIAITPIACADIYSGQNSGAIRYLKGLLAFGLYGAGIFFILAAVSAMNMQSLSDFANSLAGVDSIADGFTAVIEMLKFIATCLVTPFAGLACMGAVRTAAKEALS